jgi:hypothetical protein
VIWRGIFFPIHSPGNLIMVKMVPAKLDVSSIQILITIYNYDSSC